MSRLHQAAAWPLLALVCAHPFYAAQSAEEFYRRGTQLLAEHQPAEAIAALERSVKLKPGFAPGWQALGVVYAAQGDYERAAEAFRNACERQPNLTNACLYYGRTLYLLNRFDPAIGVLRSALPRDRSNAEIYRLIALAQEALGRVAEATEAFQTAVGLNHGGVPNEDPGIDYGVYLFRQGRAVSALEPLERALKRYPDAARAHLELGCVLLALDRLAEAQVHLERAVALDPQSSRSHLLLGKVYLRLGKTEAGEEQLRLGAQMAT